MPRNGKTLRQRFEELGFSNPDSDEKTHDTLDALVELRSMAAIDKAFYELAVKERNYANTKLERLEREAAK